MIVETPLLDEIEVSKWFTTVYNAGQQEEIGNLLDKRVWITADRRKIPVKEMETSHIKRCINCWEGKGWARIPVGYLGGKTKWLKIFQDELNSRQ